MREFKLQQLLDIQKEVQKVIIEMNKALKVLEQIQNINEEIIDREKLYNLLITSEIIKKITEKEKREIVIDTVIG